MFFFFKQFKKCKEACKEPALALDSVFATVLKQAYARGSSTLLEDDIQTKLRDLASQLPSEQLVLGVKHVLLYLKSTVEDFGNVRVMCCDGTVGLRNLFGDKIHWPVLY